MLFLPLDDMQHAEYNVTDLHRVDAAKEIRKLSNCHRSSVCLSISGRRHNSDNSITKL